jgi:hypothetical protein
MEMVDKDQGLGFLCGLDDMFFKSMGSLDLVV